MTEPAEEPRDPRSIPRLSSFVPRIDRVQAGTPDTGAPWDDSTLSPECPARRAGESAQTRPNQ
jgi:hypothetical protein